MERFQRGHAFFCCHIWRLSLFFCSLTPHYCLWLSLACRLLIWMISEQIQGQHLSSGQAAAHSGALPRRARDHETSNGG